MGRAPCCDKANVKRGPWSPEEDDKLKQYMEKYGTVGNWIALPQKAGLKRCGKSCRLRWLNYLRPNIKHGEFSEEEDRIICSLYSSIGSRWSIIAAQLQGRTDNDIKNYWNTKLKKKLIAINIIPSSQKLQNQKVNPPFSFLQNSSILSSPYSSPSPPLSSSPYNNNNNYFYNFASSTITNSFNNNNSNKNNNNSIINDPTMVVNGQIGFVGPTHNNSNQIINGGYGDESSLDYGGLEEIKQLISTTNVSSNLNLYYDENKIEEKVLY